MRSLPAVTDESRIIPEISGRQTYASPMRQVPASEPVPRRADVGWGGNDTTRLLPRSASQLPRKGPSLFTHSGEDDGVAADNRRTNSSSSVDWAARDRQRRGQSAASSSRAPGRGSSVLSWRPAEPLVERRRERRDSSPSPEQLSDDADGAPAASASRRVDDSPIDRSPPRPAAARPRSVSQARSHSGREGGSGGGGSRSRSRQPSEARLASQRRDSSPPPSGAALVLSLVDGFAQPSVAWSTYDEKLERLEAKALRLQARDATLGIGEDEEVASSLSGSGSSSEWSGSAESGRRTARSESVGSSISSIHRPASRASVAARVSPTSPPRRRHGSRSSVSDCGSSDSGGSSSADERRFARGEPRVRLSPAHASATAWEGEPLLPYRSADSPPRNALAAATMPGTPRSPHVLEPRRRIAPVLLSSAAAPAAALGTLETSAVGPSESAGDPAPYAGMPHASAASPSSPATGAPLLSPALFAGAPALVGSPAEVVAHLAMTIQRVASWANATVVAVNATAGATGSTLVPPLPPLPPLPQFFPSAPPATSAWGPPPVPPQLRHDPAHRSPLPRALLAPERVHGSLHAVEHWARADDDVGAERGHRHRRGASEAPAFYSPQPPQLRRSSHSHGRFHDDEEAPSPHGRSDGWGSRHRSGTHVPPQPWSAPPAAPHRPTASPSPSPLLRSALWRQPHLLTAAERERRSASRVRILDPALDDARARDAGRVWPNLSFSSRPGVSDRGHGGVRGFSVPPSLPKVRSPLAGGRRAEPAIIRTASPLRPPVPGYLPSLPSFLQLRGSAYVGPLQPAAAAVSPLPPSPSQPAALGHPSSAQAVESRAPSAIRFDVGPTIPSAMGGVGTAVDGPEAAPEIEFSALLPGAEMEVGAQSPAAENVESDVGGRGELPSPPRDVSVTSRDRSESAPDDASATDKRGATAIPEESGPSIDAIEHCVNDGADVGGAVDTLLPAAAAAMLEVPAVVPTAVPSEGAVSVGIAAPLSVEGPQLSSARAPLRSASRIRTVPRSLAAAHPTPPLGASVVRVAASTKPSSTPAGLPSESRRTSARRAASPAPRVAPIAPPVSSADRKPRVAALPPASAAPPVRGPSLARTSSAATSAKPTAPAPVASVGVLGSLGGIMSCSLAALTAAAAASGRSSLAQPAATADASTRAKAPNQPPVLQSTRSGRTSVPVLRGWQGERLTVTNWLSGGPGAAVLQIASPPRAADATGTSFAPGASEAALEKGSCASGEASALGRGSLAGLALASLVARKSKSPPPVTVRPAPPPSAEVVAEVVADDAVAAPKASKRPTAKQQRSLPSIGDPAARARVVQKPNESSDARPSVTKAASPAASPSRAHRHAPAPSASPQSAPAIPGRTSKKRAVAVPADAALTAASAPLAAAAAAAVPPGDRTASTAAATSERRRPASMSCQAPPAAPVPAIAAGTKRKRGQAAAPALAPADAHAPLEGVSATAAAASDGGLAVPPAATPGDPTSSQPAGGTVGVAPKRKRSAPDFFVPDAPPVRARSKEAKPAASAEAAAAAPAEAALPPPQAPKTAKNRGKVNVKATAATLANVAPAATELPSAAAAATVASDAASLSASAVAAVSAPAAAAAPKAPRMKADAASLAADAPDKTKAAKARAGAAAKARAVSAKPLKEASYPHAGDAAAEQGPEAGGGSTEAAPAPAPLALPLLPSDPDAMFSQLAGRRVKQGEGGGGAAAVMQRLGGKGTLKRRRVERGIMQAVVHGGVGAAAVGGAGAAARPRAGDVFATGFFDGRRAAAAAAAAAVAAVASSEAVAASPAITGSTSGGGRGGAGSSGRRRRAALPSGASPGAAGAASPALGDLSLSGLGISGVGADLSGLDAAAPAPPAVGGRRRGFGASASPGGRAGGGAEEEGEDGDSDDAGGHVVDLLRPVERDATDAFVMRAMKRGMLGGGGGGGAAAVVGGAAGRGRPAARGRAMRGKPRRGGIVLADRAGAARGPGAGFVRGVRSDGSGTLAAVLGQGDGGGEGGGGLARQGAAGVAVTATLSPGGTARLRVQREDAEDEAGDDEWAGGSSDEGGLDDGDAGGAY